MSRTLQIGHRGNSETQEARGWPVDVIVILSALAGLMVYLQCTTLDKYRFSTMFPGLRYGTFREYFGVLLEQISVDAADAAVAGLIVCCFLALIGLEASGRKFSRFLDQVFATEKRTLVFLGLSFLVLVRYYFALGEMWTGDASIHVVYAWITSEAFLQGEMPIWSNYYSAGIPFLQFYGFLFYYAVGVVNLLLHHQILSMKLVMAFCHVLSGLMMYLFARSLLRSRPAGAIAGFAYVLCFWHLQHVLIMGRLPLSMFYALLPCPFYLFERAKGGRMRVGRIWLGGLSLGLLAFTHPGYAMWATLLFAAYAGLRTLQRRTSRVLMPMVLSSLLIVALGLMFGAYLTLPMWVERGATSLYRDIRLSTVPDPTVQQLVVWSNYYAKAVGQPASFDHWYGGYLGISVIALGLTGVAGALSFRAHRRLACCIPGGTCLLIALLLVFGYRWPIISDLMIVQAMASCRYLLFVTFFLCLMAGAGAEFLRARKPPDPARRRVAALALLAMLADLGTTTFRYPYFPDGTWLTEPEGVYAQLVQDTEHLPVGMLPSYRVVHETANTHLPLINAWLAVKSRTPTPHLVHIEAALAEPAFATPLMKRLDQISENTDDPTAWAADPSLVGGFALLNTKRVIIGGQGEPKGSDPSVSWDYPAPTPVMVSSRAAGVNYPPADFTDRGVARVGTLIEAMELDLDAGRLGRVLLTDFGPEVDLGTWPRATVLQHKVWNQRVEMRVKVSADCFARLAYAHYPYLSVRVNGTEVTPYVTAGRFIALRLNAGEHEIVLEPFLSPLRRGLLALDIGLLALGAFLCYRERMRDQR